MGATTSNPFASERHFYYALARALNNGYVPNSDTDISRPALPIELVLDIFDLAGIVQPDPTELLAISSREECKIVSFGPRKEELYLWSPPLSRAFLARVRKMRLHTISRDQGWVGDPEAGSWSWFEVGILQPVGDRAVPDSLETVELKFSGKGSIAAYSQRDDKESDHGAPPYEGSSLASEAHDAATDYEGLDPPEETSRTTGLSLPSETGSRCPNPPPFTGRYSLRYSTDNPMEQCRWESHHNKLASREYSPLDGPTFGTDHRLWENVKEGDVIGVYACAMFGAWQNHVKYGKMEFWEKFSPLGLGTSQKGGRT